MGELETLKLAATIVVMAFFVESAVEWLIGEWLPFVIADEKVRAMA